MTDDKIITALGCCWRNANHIECTSNCPMYEYCESDQEDEMNICGLALDLINRQKAEIEALKAERDNYKEWYFGTVKENNQLNKDLAGIADCEHCKHNCPDAADSCSALEPCKDGSLWEWKGGTK